MRPPSALRVLFVAFGEAGGAEYALATHLRHRPEDVEASALLLAPGPGKELLEAAGVRVSVGSVRVPITIAGAAGFERRLLGELRRHRPDLVHATGVREACLCAPVCRVLRVPLVWHKVDLAFDRRLASPLSRVCRGVVAVSEAAAAAIPPKRLLAIVPPPVRLPEDFVVASPRPLATLGTIGRLATHKGHHHVIEAAGRLRDEFPDIRVLIAGGPVPYDTGCEALLRETAARWQIDDRVELLGHVQHVEEVLERLTLLVNATYREQAEGFGHEALGAAIIEASWAGLPVVATSGGGAPEAVREGVTATLVPPAQPAAIAAAVRHYLANPPAAEAAGRAGADFARERFRPDVLTERLFSALRTALSRGRER